MHTVRTVGNMINTQYLIRYKTSSYLPGDYKFPIQVARESSFSLVSFSPWPKWSQWLLGTRRTHVAGVLVVEETQEADMIERWEVMIFGGKVPANEGFQKVGSCGNPFRGLLHVYVRRLERGEYSEDNYGIGDLL